MTDEKAAHEQLIKHWATYPRSAMTRKFDVLRTLVLIAMLAATVSCGAPADAQTFLSLRCRDGTEFVAMFYQGPRNAYVQLDGKAMTLPRRLSFSGTRYSAGGITLRIRENGATLSRGQQSTDCSSSNYR